MLGGGGDVAAGRVDDQDPALGGRRDVDVVDADTGPADDAEPLTGLQDGLGDLGLRV